MVICYASIAATGFLLSIFFIALLKKFSLRYNLLIHKGIPLVGGLGMALSFIIVAFLSLFICRGISKEIIGIIVACTLVLFFGAIDDRHELSIRAKFLAQFIAAATLISFGVKTQIVYIGNLANLIITLTWIIGITNAFNHLDVMDGVASGSAMMISGAFFIISLLNGDMRTAILSLALASTIASLFLYNFPPAKVYMGNSGSHFLGFVLASVALMISYAPLDRKIALLSPLAILGLPIFDTSFLIIMRLRRKRLPFRKSNDHIPLRLLKFGYSKGKTLLSALILCLFFSLGGVLLSQVSNPWGIVILALLIVTSLIIAYKLSKVYIDD